MVSLGIKGARWIGCWDSLWTTFEGACTRRSLVVGTSGWFIESLIVWGSNWSASHGYVSYSKFRVGSRDASGGGAITTKDKMVE